MRLLGLNLCNAFRLMYNEVNEVDIKHSGCHISFNLKTILRQNLCHCGFQSAASTVECAQDIGGSRCATDAACPVRHRNE